MCFASSSPRCFCYAFAVRPSRADSLDVMSQDVDQVSGSALFARCPTWVARTWPSCALHPAPVGAHPVSGAGSRCRLPGPGSLTQTQPRQRCQAEEGTEPWHSSRRSVLRIGLSIHEPPPSPRSSELWPSFERSLIRERQAEGIAQTIARAVYRGRSRSPPPDQVEEAWARVEAGVPHSRAAPEGWRESQGHG